ncbi:MAG: hypothetical protein AB7D27_07385 [Desulfomicrobium sp.]
MAESRDSYERIMALGQEERNLIALQDTERLGVVLREREQAITAFMAGSMGEQDQLFLEKLKSIQEMNSHLRHEARALHQSLKEELLKVRQENKRIGGYKNGALITPLTRHALNRKG